MKHPLLAALIAAGVGPAFAETPMTAEAFDAYVTGYTVTYQQRGSVFGIEEYLPDRKVRWSVSPNQCLYGSWYPEGENICFAYEDSPYPACWTFWMRNGVLVALSVNDLPGAELSEADRNQTPLPCPGPDVGV